MGQARTSWSFMTAALERAIAQIAARVTRIPRFRALDPEEIGLLALLRVRDLVESGRRELSERAVDEGFLVRLVVNVAREHLRWLRRLPGAGLPDPDAVTVATMRPAWDATGRPEAAATLPAEGRHVRPTTVRMWARRELGRRLAALAPPATATQVEVLRARLHGQSFREIGLRVGRDASSLRERLRRLIRRLQGVAGRAGVPAPLPPVAPAFMASWPSRWRHVHSACGAGVSRRTLATRLGISQAALAALLRRIRRASRRGPA